MIDVPVSKDTKNSLGYLKHELGLKTYNQVVVALIMFHKIHEVK